MYLDCMDACGIAVLAIPQVLGHESVATIKTSV